MLPLLPLVPDVEAILCASPKSVHVEKMVGAVDGVQFVECLPFHLWRRRDAILERDLGRFAPDVIFIPMERYYRYQNVPTVNQLLNMFPMVRSQSYHVVEKLRNITKRISARRALSRADRVIAVSRFVQEHLIRDLAISTERIGLVYPGAEASLCKSPARPTTIPEEWGTGFHFTAGSIDPYRGLEDLLGALAVLRSRGMRCRCAIAGSHRPIMKGYAAHLQRMAREWNLAPDICWTGQLAWEEMSWCYQCCSAFIMTSRVEASPNIALEAMSHGCLIISAQNPPLPEFFGAGAIFYRPFEKESLAGAIATTQQMRESERDSLRKRAMEESGRFSWRSTAEKTVLELKKAVEMARQ